MFKFIASSLTLFAIIQAIISACLVYLYESTLKKTPQEKKISFFKSLVANLLTVSILIWLTSSPKKDMVMSAPFDASPMMMNPTIQQPSIAQASGGVSGGGGV